MHGAFGRLNDTTPMYTDLTENGIIPSCAQQLAVSVALSAFYLAFVPFFLVVLCVLFGGGCCEVAFVIRGIPLNTLYAAPVLRVVQIWRRNPCVQCFPS